MASNDWASYYHDIFFARSLPGLRNRAFHSIGDEAEAQPSVLPWLRLRDRMRQHEDRHLEFVAISELSGSPI